MTTEQKLLNDAAEEIVRLRKQNQVMSIKLEMFDKMVMLVGARPEYQGEMLAPRVDIVSEIDEYLRENLDDLSKAVRETVIKR